ncbi:MAG: nuclear transport factor 2 family protein [Bryobacteraceae bacterium]|jgi:uncharacterized protein (TIGR02246 family)
MSTSPESPEAVARAFADAINRQSPDLLAELMTEDHVFIDALGTRVAGREAMRAGWTAYYRMVPDYSITVTETYSAGPVVVMLGTAQGSFAAEHWQTPAAWRAEIRGVQVAEWRVYADNEPIRQLLSKHRP